MLGMLNGDTNIVTPLSIDDFDESDGEATITASGTVRGDYEVDGVLPIVPMVLTVWAEKI